MIGSQCTFSGDRIGKARRPTAYARSGPRRSSPERGGLCLEQKRPIRRRHIAHCAEVCSGPILCDLLKQRNAARICRRRWINCCCAKRAKENVVVSKTHGGLAHRACHVSCRLGRNWPSLHPARYRRVLPRSWVYNPRRRVLSFGPCASRSVADYRQ